MDGFQPEILKTGTPEKNGIEARTLMIGITLGGKSGGTSKAWPHQSVVTSGGSWTN